MQELDEIYLPLASCQLLGPSGGGN